MSADPTARPLGPSPEEQERKVRIAATLVFIIVGLSVTLSYDWGAPTPRFRPEAGLLILLGIVVATIVYVAARYASQTGGPFGFGLRFCPECGRQIRFDATVCPYCNHRLP